MLNRAKMKEIREQVDAALHEVGLNLGVSLSLGNGSFGDTEGHFKLKVVNVGAGGGVVENPERKSWSVFCKQYGLRVDDLDKVFVVNGTNYKIEGVKPSRSKFPISAKRVSDGRGFKFPAESVLIGLRRVLPVVDEEFLFGGLRFGGNKEI
jgi:hypothetical protein